jgi:hypothetical protein
VFCDFRFGEMLACVLRSLASASIPCHVRDPPIALLPAQFVQDSMLGPLACQRFTPIHMI